MIYATASSLNIGRIDSLQKLHVRTIRLGNEAPRRICYSKILKAYGVVFLQEVLDRLSGDIYRSSSFKILDEATFDGKSAFLLSLRER
jgi:DNA damage-binding protein 1